jgi:hypothetical protein
MSRKKKEPKVESIILSRLDSLDSKLDEVRTKDLPGIRGDIRELNVKSGIWGGVSGLVSACVVYLGLGKH